MLQMLLLSAIPLTIFLSGCQSRPDQLIQHQRFIHFEYIEIQGKRYIDLETSFCLEREYQYSLQNLGPVTKFKNVSIENCDKLTGYDPVSYVRVHNFLDDVRREIQDHE